MENQELKPPDYIEVSLLKRLKQWKHNGRAKLIRIELNIMRRRRKSKAGGRPSEL
jgi:hypothetical protein